MGRLTAMAIAFATLSGCVEDRETSNPAAIATEIVLTEELRIGGLDGPEEYTFGYVTAIAPAPDGTILISDRQGPVLRR